MIQKKQLLTCILIGFFQSGTLLFSQLKPVSSPEWKLVWSDEFSVDGVPDSKNWTFEYGFVRNKEWQWYQKENAYCLEGKLCIEGRREKVKNPNFILGSKDWRTSRGYAGYTSACLLTKGLHQWKYGRFEICARIDTSMGLWPAIWTLGVEKEWPHNGEIDLMEFYRIENVPNILANTAWGTEKQWVAKWNSVRTPFEKIARGDRTWASRFHVWRMDWSYERIDIYLDEVLLNHTSLDETNNPDGSNPFRQPHYLLLNLAIGENGGDPASTRFPVKYEIDYVRVYQKAE
jgi:beta-glucanase (GH16 family)